MKQALPAAQASGPGGMPVPQTSAAARGLRLCFVLQEYARPGILRPGYAQGIDPHRPRKEADVSPSRRQTGQKATFRGRKELRQTRDPPVELPRRWAVFFAMPYRILAESCSV